MFDPVFEAEMSESGLPRASVDLSDFGNPLWETFDIRVVPTVIVFKEGQVAFRKDGIFGRGLAKGDMTDIVDAMS